MPNSWMSMICLPSNLGMFIFIILVHFMVELLNSYFLLRLSLLCVLNVTLLLYKPTPIVLQNARSRRSVTDHSRTRSTEVEHVHVHVHAPGTGIEDVIVTDPEVGHATEAGHAIEAGRVTETVTVAVGKTGINVVAAEAGVVTVIGKSVTVCVSLTTRIGEGFLPRHLGELALDWSLLQFLFFCL